MTIATHYGSAMTDKVGPWSAAEIEVRGPLTVMAVAIAAADDADARRRLQAWHAIAAARNALSHISGHMACGRCECAAWMGIAKEALDVLANRVRGMQRGEL
jgi:hypothetical protein